MHILLMCLSLTLIICLHLTVHVFLIAPILSTEPHSVHDRDEDTVRGIAADTSGCVIGDRDRQARAQTAQDPRH